MEDGVEPGGRGTRPGSKGGRGGKVEELERRVKKEPGRRARESTAWGVAWVGGVVQDAARVRLAPQLPLSPLLALGAAGARFLRGARGRQAGPPPCLGAPAVESAPRGSLGSECTPVSRGWPGRFAGRDHSLNCHTRNLKYAGTREILVSHQALGHPLAIYSGCGGNEQRRALVSMDSLAWSVLQKHKSRIAVHNDNLWLDQSGTQTPPAYEARRSEAYGNEQISASCVLNRHILRPKVTCLYWIHFLTSGKGPFVSHAHHMR
ncbi:uncharacterized protein LOC123600471 [Leopardus geoffroyi]|uniref:uncharacterized protein LOC123600471 n=1 Tax=Leopardus geoffroyi TaxID=46844 RepID=UPI001E261540|nr:uncharacterized protein LOC123600471 [Leopardus geoffroyi]